MTAHLVEYLSYYETLDAPGYAVLVNGHWGVGKTHQVRSCISEENCYYVSLFGLQNQNEAHAAVYAAYAPNLDRFGKILGTAGDAAGGAGGVIALGGAAANLLSASMRQKIKADRTLIFDDLERCSMNLEEMMGLFSTYVEHLGFRVVLIADEEKLIAKHPEYSQAKEKVVGHTASVEPMTSNAFDAFAKEVDGLQKEFVEQQKKLVLELFLKANCMSLRVLRHVIFDLARLHKCLLLEHVQHDTARQEIVGLFVSCGIEVRLGRIKPSDLQNRAGQRMGFEMKRYASKDQEPVEPPLITADNRYPTVNLENQILDDAVLKAIFEHGVFDAHQIKTSINQSQHFIDPKDLPAWKLVASFDKIADEVFLKALDEMNDQFLNRKVSCSGEMLHIFSLRLMMAEEGILETDLDTTCEECIRYIDDLLAADRLPPRELDWRWWDSFDRAYGGYGYWVRPTYQEHFKLIWDRLIAAREEALEVTFPEKAAELLKILENDEMEFYRQLCQTAGHDSPYALIPILKCLVPSEFVDLWLTLPRPKWRWISRALEDRLEPHRAQHELASEREWAIQVMQELEARCDDLTGFERLRVRRIIPQKLNRLKDEVSTGSA